MKGLTLPYQSQMCVFQVSYKTLNQKLDFLLDKTESRQSDLNISQTWQCQKIFQNNNREMSAFIKMTKKEVTTTCIPFVSWQRVPQNL